FPMHEYIKDDTAPEGWRVKTYGGKDGETENVTADMMEEVKAGDAPQEPETTSRANL
ncbi:hypothetical protein KEM55_002881, partial [Ascosphaera atra]